MFLRYKNKNWVKTMKIKFDFNNMMSHNIGDKGINNSDIENISSLIQESILSIKKKRYTELAWMNLPYTEKSIIDEILSISENIKSNFDNFVLIGIGGQALGPIAVHEALNHAHYNELPKEKRNGCPRFYVPDNVDPERMNALFDIIDVTKTKFFISSKSGNTSETLSQFMIITDMLRQKLGDNYKNNIICLTNSEKGSLLEIIKNEGYEWLVMTPGVGGRFSVLSNAGLLPAAVCGIDIEEMLAGAAYMDEYCSKDNIYENPAYLAAILQYIAMKKNRNISVMMPYSHGLRYISDWYAQLWAESLGKRFDKNNNEIFAGQTPVKALGVTDQHSQIQLYTEGPFDKVITFIRIENYRSDIRIPEIYNNVPGASFLCGHTLGELINAEQYATEYALTKANRMNYTITVPEINPFTIGQLLYFFEVQTAFAGELLQLDAFNQPGVEEGKKATFALLGREGFEDKKKEMDNAFKKLDKYII